MAWPASGPAWTVINDLIYGAYWQMLSYNTQLFNAATKGGLVLRTGPAIPGDYEKMTFFNRLSGLVRDRDITSDATVSAIDFNTSDISRVKYAKGTPPVRIDDHRWQWIGQEPAKAAAQIAKQLAEETLADNLSVAASALIGFNSNVGATLTYDGTAGTTTLAGLTNAAQLWGDRSSQIKCWLMHSKPFTDLQLAALANATSLFKFGDVNVVADQLGRPFIVSDLSALVYTSSGTKYHILGLSEGAVTLETGNDFLTNVETENGKENIARTFQAQWTNNIGIKGAAWNTAVVHPTTAQVGTGTNWTKVATSVKDCGAILANFQ